MDDHRASLAAAHALLLLAAVVLPAQSAEFAWLGDLPGGAWQSRAFAISADGRVIVGASESGGGTEAFRHEAGVMTGLGDVPGASPYRSVALGVSGDGAVVVGQSSDWQNPPYQAFRFEGGTMVGLGWLSAEAPYQRSTGRDVSADGAVIAGDVINRAATWAAGSWTFVDGLPASSGYSTLASAISADGAVVAGSIQNVYESYVRPFVAADGQVTVLGTLDPDEPFPWAIAEAISADGGTIVGRGSSIGPSYEAFRHQDGAMLGLGVLPGGVDSDATGVSADGNVVVGAGGGLFPDGGATGGDIAFIWTPATGMMRLWDFLYAQGVRGVGTRALGRATAISDDGRTIVGFGRNATGQTEAWRVTLDAASVADADGDAIPDALDNCTAAANPDQRDTDRDGFGNACDGDLDNSGGIVNARDLAIFRSHFGSSYPDADFDGSFGLVNATDLALFRTFFGKPAGPAATAPQ